MLFFLEKLTLTCEFKDFSSLTHEQNIRCNRSTAEKEGKRTLCVISLTKILKIFFSRVHIAFGVGDTELCAWGVRDEEVESVVGDIKKGK